MKEGENIVKGWKMKENIDKGRENVERWKGKKKGRV